MISFPIPVQWRHKFLCLVLQHREALDCIRCHSMKHSTQSVWVVLVQFLECFHTVWRKGIEKDIEELLQALIPVQSQATHEWVFTEDTEWVRLEGTRVGLSGSTSAQAGPSQGRGLCLQTVLECLHTLSGVCPVLGHYTGKKFCLMTRWKLLDISSCLFLSSHFWAPQSRACSIL